MQEPKRFELAFYVPPASADLAEYLAALRDMGIRCIGTDGFVEWRDERLIDKIAETIAAAGMKVVSSHASIGLRWPDGERIDQALADNRKIIDCAAKWGSPSTVWHFRWFRGERGPTNDGNFAEDTVMEGFTGKQIDALMAEVLPETCVYAAEKGVGINIENIGIIHWNRNAYELLEFLRRQDLSNLGFILDSGHAWCSGQDPAELIRKAGPLLRDTHFHDCIGPRGFDLAGLGRLEDVHCRDLHAIVGLGTINWFEVVRALWEIDFPGPVVFEGCMIAGHPDNSTIQHWARCMDLTIRMWRAFEEAATYWPDPPDA